MAAAVTDGKANGPAGLTRPKLRLKSIQFRAASSPGKTPLKVLCPNVTVLIGPNNSGKSQTLREIEDECTGANSSERHVLDTVELETPSTSEGIMTLLEPFKRGAPHGQSTQPGCFWLRRPGVGAQGETQTQVPENGFVSWLAMSDWRQLKVYFTSFLTRRLDGATRFNLVSHTNAGPLEQAPANHLWALFVDDAARAKVSAFTQAAFNRFFVIDPTGMTQFRMRLSDRAPADATEEQSVDARARAFHAAASLVTDLGDGVKASVGLVTAVHSLPDRILLIDEPEAFLHPTLARRIGRVLSETARERDASLVVATHSAEFLIGCVQGMSELRLVRLTYEAGQPTARTLEPGDIKVLMNDPLLRSANALRALFHRGVLVCEADADRSFYEEVNGRLGDDDKRGIADALFMNAQNWQTIPRIVEPLRRLGVPAAGIFDFDVLMDDAFKHIWSLVHVAPTELESLHKERAEAKSILLAQGRKRVKQFGLDALSDPDRATLKKLMNRFSAQGVFFLPVGELEGWLPAARIPRGDKAAWIVKMFEYLGADPQDKSYVSAGADDVWAFIGDVKAWIDNPNRQGIPA